MLNFLDRRSDLKENAMKKTDFSNIHLEPVDLSQAKKHECSGINDQDYFLAHIGDILLLGKFSRQWFGWNFDCGWGESGRQFDAPEWNASDWKKLWRVVI